MRKFLLCLIFPVFLVSQESLKEWNYEDFKSYSYFRSGINSIVIIPINASVGFGQRVHKSKNWAQGYSLNAGGGGIFAPYCSLRYEFLYYLENMRGRYWGISPGLLFGNLLRKDGSRLGFFPLFEIIVYGKEKKIRAGKKIFYQWSIYPIGLSFDHGWIF